MKHVYLKHNVGTIMTFPNGDRHLLCGRLPDGKGLVARDWTRGNEDEDTNMAGDETFFAPHVRQARLKNYRGHAPRAKHGVKEFIRDGANHGKVWIISGSGPSLAQTAPLVRKAVTERDDVFVLALNASLDAIGHEYVDAFMVLCWLSSDKWWVNTHFAEGIRLFTSFYNPPGVLDHFDPDMTYHFAAPLRDPMLPFTEGDIQKYGTLDCGLSVTYSAMHLAFRAKASKIILVGQDAAYTWGMGHYQEPLKFETAEERGVIPVKDMHGNVTITDPRLRRHAALIRGAAYWCEHGGIPCYNSTDQGCLNFGPRRTVPLEEALRDARVPELQAR